MSDEMIDQLKELQKTTGDSMSRYVRDAIKERMKKEKTKCKN